MSRIVFLLEEPSMRLLLEALMPRLFPGVKFVCVTHEGKQDLEKSIPRKLRAWREPGVRFMVVRDNDNSDCRRLKARLQSLCTAAGRPDTMIRIPCQELEAWYLGEIQVLAEVYGKPRLLRLQNRAKFRNPDGVQDPSREIERLIPEFQKLSAARRMGARLSMSENRSQSYNVMISGLKRLSATAALDAMASGGA